MTDDAPDDHDCHKLHHLLAGHMLYALNLLYNEVAVTHLRVTETPGEPDKWEAEVILESLGVAYTARDDCPLEAAIAAATATVAALDVVRGSAGAVLN